MKSFRISIVIAAGVLVLSAGTAFANNLHLLVPDPNPNPQAASAAPGQTGSNVFSSCEDTNGAKTNSGTGSPFGPNSADKKYAGNPGNPATNPKAVSQYDNACEQAAQHQMP